MPSLIAISRAASRISSVVTRSRGELQFFAGLAALGLGFWGWSIERPATDWASYTNNAFRTLQLITLNFPTNFDGQIPWQLQLARLMVPLVAILASFNVLMGTVTRPLRLALLPRTRGHVVVCGDTKLTEAALLKLAERGREIVIVTPAISSARRDMLESQGLTMVEADARRDGALRHLSLRSAAALFVTGADDLDNLNLAMSALVSAEERLAGLPPLILAVMIEREDLAIELDLALDGVARRHQLRYHRLCPDREGISLELARFAPVFTKPAPSEPSHVLIVGLAGRYEQVLAELLLCTQDHPDQSPLFSFALTEKEARGLEAWRVDRPDVALVVRFEIMIREEGRVPADPVLSDWHQRNGKPHLVVVMGSDADAMAAAFVLRRPHSAAGTDDIPILVRQEREDRLLQSVDSAGQVGSQKARLIAFGGLIRAESIERVLDRKGDEAAMALHAGYLAAEFGRSAQSSETALRQWDALSETLKEANRSAARHLSILLASAGLETIERANVERNGWPAVELAPGQIEHLAKVEHRHWMASRIDQGWRSGPARDDSRRLHPAIVPYDELSAIDKQKDRDTVRRLIDIQSSRGLVLSRLNPAA